MLGVLLGVILAAPSWAEDCGDTAGFDGARMPCACGDNVVTNTKLRKTDPVVSASPGDVCGIDGLAIIVDGITLDCAGFRLRGDGGPVGAEVGVFLDAVKEVTLKNCKIENFGPGIWVDQSSNFTLQNNTVRFSFSSGILIVNSTKGTVKQNEAADNEGDGIELIDTTNTTVDKNNVVKNAGHGIDLDDSRTNVISNNFVSDNGFDGISIAGSPDPDNNAIVDNLVKRNKIDGIRLFGSADSNVIARNQVSHNGQDGIDLDDEDEDGNFLDSNTGKGNVENGIEVSGSDNFVGNNNFSKNGQHGICVVVGNFDIGSNTGHGNGLLPDVDFACPDADDPGGV
jgi:parallel beta-helix repeat protein